MKALFGGTFDPVHNGHMHLAQQALRQLAADSVVFLPAGQNPLKQVGPIASAAQRVAMLRAAISETPDAAFEIAEVETNRQGPSFTVDTLEQLPRGDWTLLMGSEVFRSLPQWKNPRRLLQLARIAVITRPGTVPPQVDETLSALNASSHLTSQVTVLHLDLLPFSSTQIRTRLGDLDKTQWESERCPVPGLQRGVWQIIKENRLYSR